MKNESLLPICFALVLSACELTPEPEVKNKPDPLDVSSTLTEAQTPSGEFISWREHLIDSETVNGGIPIRGGDGLAAADINKDGIEDFISVHEDSNHLRIAFGTPAIDKWELITLASGDEVRAIEDVAVGDLNGDGWPDLIAACEEAHLIYFQNPGENSEQTIWPKIIPEITQGRGSWLRVFIADMDQDGRLDVLAPNKGASDIIDPASGARAALSTSLFTISGDPLEQSSWQEQSLSLEVVPNTAMPVDIDDDGDMDVLAAARIKEKISILENEKIGENGIEISKHPIEIVPGTNVPSDWEGKSSAFQSVFSDMDRDGRKDLIVSVMEPVQNAGETLMLPMIGWLRQPESLEQPWYYYRIGDTLPDAIVGIALADIDGDGDADVVTGGYSGLNIIDGGYSGASRDKDDDRVTPASTVGRITWFENTGQPKQKWKRHDISRRVRGMYDGFIARDMDKDGDLDLIATRGNSGENDGLFWLEQIRSAEPVRAFTPARADDSQALPLPPENWIDLYGNEITYIAPNKK